MLAFESHEYASLFEQLYQREEAEAVTEVSETKDDAVQDQVADLNWC